ncbi:hypothetical protein GDO86_000448 [Hymenochirus boettgeri]|uniref:Uncharacterized protein n=1 Tax=Hymenochirus boettgeri TaxID=247094 RepID=A0A8T2KD86_9PIPI|nr:hypothetical protein GDO86_000448 [Hymenochirus boettgeri]
MTNAEHTQAMSLVFWAVGALNAVCVQLQLVLIVPSSGPRPATLHNHRDHNRLFTVTGPERYH